MFTSYGRQRAYIPVGKMAVNVLIFEVRNHVMEPNLRNRTPGCHLSFKTKVSYYGCFHLSVWKKVGVLILILLNLSMVQKVKSFCSFLPLL